MNTVQKRLAVFALVLVSSALSAALAWRLGAGSATTTEPPATAAAEREVLYWYDPMVPQQRFEQPGKSPFMDMDLVPKYADEAGESSGVRIDPRVTQNLGLRLAQVERVPLRSSVLATGVLGFDQRAVIVEQARVAGFVERVWPLAPGDVVHAGQPLLELRAPEWAAAEREWQLLKDSSDRELRAAARERLLQLGLPPARVRELERGAAPQQRFTLWARGDGVVQSLDVRAGMSLMPGQTLLTLNGLARVWLEVSVPEAQVAGLRAGSQVSAALAAFPGEAFAGEVQALLPALDADSRSLQLRIELDNRDGRLRPGMSAQVALEVGEAGTALAVPSEALIRTGRRTLLLRALPEGRFEPVEVQVGRELGERTVILSGVAEGESIVASGQFLIDSEASLSGFVARAAAPAEDAHAGHDMSDATEMPNVEMADAEGDAHAAHDMDEPVLHAAEARVEAIEDERIRLAHGPFKTLGMPGMTMRFRVARAELLQGIAVGDHVRVFVSDGEQGLQVERLDKLEAQP